MILCGSAEVTLRKNSRSLDIDGCRCVFVCLLFFLITVYEKLSRGSGIGRLSQTSWYIWVLLCPLLLCNPCLNKRHHTEVTVIFVRSLPTKGTADSMEHPLRFTHALSFDEKDMHHTCRAQLLSWSPNLQPKYRK